jgi:hypothetical protein
VARCDGVEAEAGHVCEGDDETYDLHAQELLELLVWRVQQAWLALEQRRVLVLERLVLRPRAGGVSI